MATCQRGTAHITSLAVLKLQVASDHQDVQDCHIMELDNDWVQNLEAQRIMCDIPTAELSDICCLTMTSGSTGGHVRRNPRCWDRVFILKWLALESMWEHTIHHSDNCVQKKPRIIRPS
eukprot:2265188-Amphidinium_carterae.2